MGACAQRPVARFALKSAASRPGVSAGDVRAGIRAWLELGYFVRKGERAIRIMASMPTKDREPDQAVGDAGSPARVLFPAVSVFDAALVTPSPSRKPMPLAVPSEPLTGECHVGLLGPLEAFGASIGFAI